MKQFFFLQKKGMLLVNLKQHEQEIVSLQELIRFWSVTLHYVESEYVAFILPP